MFVKGAKCRFKCRVTDNLLRSKSRELGEGVGEKEEASEKIQKNFDPVEEGEPEEGFRKTSDRK